MASNEDREEEESVRFVRRAAEESPLPSNRGRRLERRIRRGEDDGGESEGEDEGADAVRQNVAQEMRQRNTDPKLVMTVATVWYVPQVIASAVILATKWCGGCDAPLGLWICVSVARMIVRLLVGWITVNDDPLTRPEPFPALYKVCKWIEKPFHLFSLLWLLIGNVWLVQSGDCAETCTAIYDLTFALIALQFIVTFLPCVLFVLLLPVMCFCLPCLLRLMLTAVGRSAQKGATDDELNALSSIAYEPHDFSGDDDDRQCAICLSEYERGDMLRRLPCNHHFHKECVDGWLKLNATCPNCRDGVVKKTGGEDREDGTAPSLPDNVV